MSRMKFGRLEERVRMDQRAAFPSFLSRSLRHSFIKLITRPLSSPAATVIFFTPLIEK